MFVCRNLLPTTRVKNVFTSHNFYEPSTREGIAWVKEGRRGKVERRNKQSFNPAKLLVLYDPNDSPLKEVLKQRESKSSNRLHSYANTSASYAS